MNRRRTSLLAASLLLVGWRWPGELNKLAAQADSAYRDGRYDEAAAGYASALAEQPGSPELLYDLATSQLHGGDPARAIETLGLAEQGADDPALRDRIHYNRGMALVELGQLEPAIAAFEDALSEDPNDADAAYNRDLLKRLLQRHPPPPGQGGGRGQGQGDGGQAPSPQPNQPRDPRSAAGGNRPPPGSNGQDEQEEPRPAPRMSEREVDDELRKLEEDELNYRLGLNTAPERGTGAGQPQRDW